MTTSNSPYPPLCRRGKTLTHEDQEVLAETIIDMQSPVGIETVSMLIKAQVSTTGIDAENLAGAFLRRLESRGILTGNGTTWSAKA